MMGSFTPAFDQALARIRAEDAAPAPSDARVRLVTTELDHAAPTLVDSDLADLPPAHRAFARRMLTVAEHIDALYAQQSGMTALAARVQTTDPASQALFRRNWGPRCLGALTEHEAACSALDGAPRQPVDVYPAALQSSDGFCHALEQRFDATALLSPFTVVRGRAARSRPFRTRRRTRRRCGRWRASCARRRMR
ncbi:MAG: hypothetical protein V9G19_27700 [Tetrasphaera sp.]